jgi:hypothetical protein
MSPGSQDSPGLQPERTQLSWERSAFGFLVCGALPLLGHGPLTTGKVLLAVVGALLALLVVALAHRRARRIAYPPTAEVLLTGCATAGFAVLVVAFIFH